MTIADASSGSRNPAESPIARQLPVQNCARWPERKVSRRDGRYWQDHRAAASIPPRLAELLALWANRPPTRADVPMIDELFPAASYQYILYGMGAQVPEAGSFDAHKPVPLAPIAQRTRSMVATLPPIRAYLDACRAAYQPTAMEHIS